MPLHNSYSSRLNEVIKMKWTSYCFTTLLLLVLRGDGNSDNLHLLFPTYKLVEDAVMGNPEVRFLLQQTFFPSSNYRYWQVDGAEVIPIIVCVTLQNITKQQPGTQCNLTDNVMTETDRNVERNCAGKWEFLWTNSLLMNIIPADILLAMDTTMSLIVYSEIIKSSHYRRVTLYIDLNELSLSCPPSLDDIEQAFVLLLGTVSRVTVIIVIIIVIALNFSLCID